MRALFFSLLALTPLAALHSAEAPKPRNGDKLLIAYDDGFSPFYSGRYKTAADLRKQMQLFKDTQVAVMEWCITSGSRVNFPAKTAELVGTAVQEYGRRGDQLAAGADGVHLFNVGNIPAMKSLGTVQPAPPKP